MHVNDNYKEKEAKPKVPRKDNQEASEEIEGANQEENPESDEESDEENILVCSVYYTPIKIIPPTKDTFAYTFWD